MLCAKFSKFQYHIYFIYQQSSHINSITLKGTAQKSTQNQKKIDCKILLSEERSLIHTVINKKCPLVSRTLTARELTELIHL